MSFIKNILILAEILGWSMAISSIAFLPTAPAGPAKVLTWMAACILFALAARVARAAVRCR